MAQTISMAVQALQMRFENDLVRSKVLRWPELDLIETSTVRINSLTKSRTKSLVKSGFPRFFSPICSIDPIRLALRQLPKTAEHGRIEIVFVPDERQVRWQKPSPVFFDYVLWPSQDFWIVAIPVLDIEFQLRSLAELEEKVEERIRKILSIREGRSLGLERLWEFRRIRSARLVSLPVVAELPTMPENVKREHGHAVKSETAEQWEELGMTFPERLQNLPSGYELEPQLERLDDILSEAEPSPVLLVGRGGVGKTALWHEYVKRSLENRTKTSAGVRFGETDATLLVSSSTDPDSCCGADWQSRCDRLIRLASQEPVVLHFGNLWELTQVGMWIGQSRSIAGQLVPAATGRFPFLCECTPQQLTVLEQEHPGLLFPFVKIELDEPGEEAALGIYKQVVDSAYPGVFDDAALRRTDSLHRRYATYSSIPGRPLTFLRNLALTASESETRKTTIAEADVVAAFSRETGLPLLLLEDSIPLDVDATLDWFRKRIIGQDVLENDDAPGAVSLLVETLLTYKARLSRPDRPIASLLFVGPTGVGKTETAKALAEFLYSDPKRMIRIDMSEYAEYGAAERLIRGNRQGEGLLTMKIRQQPFSVVLLDEFEKAHDEVFDLLLQVLGEGRLTDAAGRVADFRNCVILMTSNIGVERFGLPKAGFETPLSKADESRDRAVEHFTNEVSRLLRPEMLNRIDRIVPFRPLSKKSLRKILDLQIGKLDERYGISNRPLTLHVDEDVRDFLVDRSYDPRFGARPLRRILEQQLLVSLAGALENHSPETPVEVRCTLADCPDGKRIRSEVVVKRGDVDSTRLKVSRREKLGRITLLRRKIRILDEHSAVEEMKGRTSRAETLRRKYERKRLKGHEVFIPPENERFLEKVAKVDEVFIKRIAELRDRVVRLEETALLEYYREIDTENHDDFASLQDEYRQVVNDLYHEGRGPCDRVLLVVYSNSPEASETILRLYEDCSALLGFRAVRYALEPWTRPEHFQPIEKSDRLLFKSPDETLLERLRTGKESPGPDHLKQYLKSLQVVHARPADPSIAKMNNRRAPAAFLLDISGRRAGVLLAEEFGKHRLIGPKPAQRQFECSVEVSFDSLDRYFPKIDSSGSVQINDPCIRRTVDLGESESKQSRSGSVCDAHSLKRHLLDRLAETVENWLNE